MTADAGLLEYAPMILWLGLVGLSIAAAALYRLSRIR